MRTKEFTMGTESLRDFSAIIFLGLGGAALGVLLPGFAAKVFDVILPSGDPGSLRQTVLVMFLAICALHAAELLSVLLRLRLQTRLCHRRKSNMMGRILSLPVSFFGQYSIGEVLTRTGMTDAEEERLLTSLFSGVLSGFLSVSSLAVLFHFDVRAGLISSMVGAGVLGVATLSGRRQLELERAALAETTKLRSFLLQLFGAITKVQCAGAESRFFSMWSARFQRRQSARLAMNRIGGWSSAFYALIPWCGLAAFLKLKGVSPGSFFAMMTAFTLLMSGMQSLASALSDWIAVKPLLERAHPIISASPERIQSGRPPGELSGQIELRNVSFRYSPESPWIFRDVSFRIEPGQFIAVVGPSGSGKSTLLKLLLGFEQPTVGEILYDDSPLSELDLRGVRRQIGTVLQQDYLTAGNIYENIAAVRAISLEQAWEAARIAGLEPDLKRLPLGMHSFVTSGGRGFSGGERQRVMIARAVAGKPRLLFLDEATSALDNQIQAEVMRNLKQVGLTRIMIAHRLSTIRGADRVLSVERGQIELWKEERIRAIIDPDVQVTRLPTDGRRSRRPVLQEKACPGDGGSTDRCGQKPGDCRTGPHR
jgi:ABC-type bacteriocin/lantibiotic exporter with double-glycine peptidase domain